MFLRVRHGERPSDAVERFSGSVSPHELHVARAPEGFAAAAPLTRIVP